MLLYIILLSIGFSIQENVTSAKKNKLILNWEEMVMFTFDTLHEVVCNFDLIDTKLYDAFSVTFIPLQFILRLILRHKWLVYVIYIECQKNGFRRNHYKVLLIYLTRYLKYATKFYMLDILSKKLGVLLPIIDL